MNRAVATCHRSAPRRWPARRAVSISLGEEPGQCAGARWPGFERTLGVLRRGDDTTFFQRGEVLLDARGSGFDRTYLRHGITPVGNGDRRPLADQAHHLREPGLGLVCRVDGVHVRNLTSLTSQLRPGPVDPEALLQRIRRRHEELGPVDLDEATLRRLRDEGRREEEERRREGGRPPTAEQARAMCRDAAAVLGARVVRVSDDHVLDAALECGLSACDAEFVVAARELGVRLATEDRSVLRGAGDVAVRIAGY